MISRLLSVLPPHLAPLAGLLLCLFFGGCSTPGADPILTCYPATMRVQAMLPPGTWSRKLGVGYEENEQSIKHLYLLHEDPRKLRPDELMCWSVEWGDRRIRARRTDDLATIARAADPAAVRWQWLDAEPAR